MSAVLKDVIDPALEELGYLRLYRIRPTPSTEIIDVMGFSGRPSLNSACFAGDVVTSETRKLDAVIRIGQSGVRYAYLLTATGIGTIWRLDANADGDGFDPKPIEDVSLDQIHGYLIGHKSIYLAQSVQEEKYRSATALAASGQQSFVSSGLFDFRAEQTERSLIDLMNRCVRHALSVWNRIEAEPINAASRAGSVLLRLIAARSIVDKGQVPANRSNLEETVVAAYQLLPTFLQEQYLTTVPREVLKALWEGLLEVQFELLTGDMWAGPYQKALVTKEDQRTHGVHYTPRAVRRFMWDLVKAHIAEVPSAERYVLDPTCGSGGFLLTAYEGLASLDEQSLLVDHDVESFRRRIFGVDRDSFACDIARLALILQSNPTRNGWSVIPQRFEEWIPKSGNQPRLIIGNPPFGGTETLILDHSLDVLAANGILALVLPRSFLTRDNAKQVRQKLLDLADIEGIYDLPDKVFEVAQVTTCVLIARKRWNTHQVRKQTFSYSPIDRRISPAEQKRRFRIRSNAGILLRFESPVQNFISGQLQLNDVWDAVTGTVLAEKLFVFHEGISLRAKKDDPSADISDVPRSGYVPFIPDAKFHVSTFHVEPPKYLEWDPTKIHRIRQPEWWYPGKVLLCRHVTNKQLWRLIAAVDWFGLAYGTRVIGGYVKPGVSGWTPEALACLLNSSYANAWYATHSQQVNIVGRILNRLPVPAISTDQIELMTSLGTGLTACAGRLAQGFPGEEVGSTLTEVTRLLLCEMDSIVFSASGLNSELTQKIDHYLSQGEKQRPGMSEQYLGPKVILATDVGLSDHPNQTSTGVILTVSEAAGFAVAWIDSLEIRVPICISLPLVPPDLRLPGRAFKADVTNSASDLSDVSIGSIRPFPLADMTREHIVQRFADLLE